MKQFFAAITLVFFVQLADAQGFVFDSVGVQHMTIGKVILKSDTWVIRVERGGGYDDFWPVNLPDKYAIAGQEVVFEGALGRIPMQARLVGTPVKLSMIRVLYRTTPRDDDKSGESIAKEKPINPDSVGYIEKQTGRILMVNDMYLIETTTVDAKGNEEVKRYVPDFLPDDFKMAGQQITFSAIILKHDPNVRMMGTPVKIKELMMEENTPFDAKQLQESVAPYYPFDSAGRLVETKAMVKLIADVYILEVTIDNQNNITRYIPAILPESFKKEGTIVMISGTIGKIPPNVRMMGTPLTLESIRLVE